MSRVMKLVAGLLFATVAVLVLLPGTARAGGGHHANFGCFPKQPSFCGTPEHSRCQPCYTPCHVPCVKPIVIYQPVITTYVQPAQPLHYGGCKIIVHR